MRFRHILSFAALCLFFSAQGGPNNFSFKTIVIDAGHGGKDPGAIGPGKNYEKDVALAVALKLGAYIEENFPDVKVVYTRKTDVFVELHERAEIANKVKADLFIAIHCNSSPNTDFYGTSSYILGLHRTEANLEVAKRENAVILLEEDRDKNYEFNPNTPEGHIIMSMKQNAFLEQSIDFAAKVENELESYARRKSLGVKQAGFYVLYKTAMPSLLAEIGFISNPEEERYLTSNRGQDQVAAGLFNAFKDYKKEMEGGEIASKPAPAEETNNKPAVVKKEEPVKEQKPALVNTTTTTAPAIVKKEEPKAVVPTPVKEETPTPAPIKEITTTAVAKADNDVVTLSDGGVIKRPVAGTGGGGKATASIDLTPVKAVVETSTAKENSTVKKEPAPKPIIPKEPVKETKTVVTETKAAVKESKPATAVFKEPVKETKPVAEAPKETVKEAKPAPLPVQESKPTTAEKTEVKTPTVVKEELKAEVPVPVAAIHSNRHPKVPLTEAESGVVFKIQLFALKGELKDYDKFIRLFKVMSAEELPNGITRYFAAHVSSYSEAKKYHTVAVNKGFKDSYIVGFRDGKRMAPAELKNYEGE